MKCSQIYGRLFFFLTGLAITFLIMDESAFADTPLNSSNWLGSTGTHYWNINISGSYYLDIPETVFNTSNDYAIRISTSNVIIDGKGKTMTGPSAPSSSGGPGTYGIRVNGGQPISNVSVKNVNVNNKFFGVIFESVNNGSIENVSATNNRYGLYIWDSDNNTLNLNLASNNTYGGIACDADNTVNSFNVIENNIANDNGENGITLWLSCTNNTIQGNSISGNGQMGIALTSGANANIIEANSISNNSSGIWIVNSSQNKLSLNTLFNNANVGVFLQSSSNNILSSNISEQNNNAGIWLDSSTK